MLYPISVPIAQNVQNLFGRINGQGQVVVDPVFAGAVAFLEGKTSVLDQHGKTKFIDHSGLLVIPHRFQGLGRFVQSLCSINGGYIDHQGAWFISLRFLVCSDFSSATFLFPSPGSSRLGCPAGIPRRCALSVLSDWPKTLEHSANWQIRNRGVNPSSRVSINNPSLARFHKFPRRPSMLSSRALASPR
jgi:hypothetical protein